MSYTPTTGLRFIINTIGTPVLQQLFLEHGSKQVWFDVPVRPGQSLSMDNPPVKVPGHPQAMISIDPPTLDLDVASQPEQTEELRQELEKTRFDLSLANNTIVDLRAKLEGLEAENMDLRQRNNQASTNYSVLRQAHNDLQAELQLTRAAKDSAEAKLANYRELILSIGAITKEAQE